MHRCSGSSTLVGRTMAEKEPFSVWIWGRRAINFGASPNFRGASWPPHILSLYKRHWHCARCTTGVRIVMFSQNHRHYRSNVMRMSVCLFVCALAQLENYTSNLPILCMLPWLGHLLLALRYVMYFWFCGWRHIFIHWGQTARIKHDAMFRRNSPGGGTISWTSDDCSVGSSWCGTRGKVAIYDFLLTNRLKLCSLRCIYEGYALYTCP